MIEIKLFDRVGNFAEDKDTAKQIRVKEVMPFIDNEEITFDFKEIEGATQSFMHALISDLIRKKGIDILDKIYFKNCNDTTKKIIGIVVEYMQDKEEYIA